MAIRLCRARVASFAVGLILSFGVWMYVSMAIPLASWRSLAFALLVPLAVVTAAFALLMFCLAFSDDDNADNAAEVTP